MFSTRNEMSPAPKAQNPGTLVDTAPQSGNANEMHLSVDRAPVTEASVDRRQWRRRRLMRYAA